MTEISRAAAAVIALCAWGGIVLQFVDALQLTGGRALAALWSMLLYFTIFTNLLVAGAFTAVAFGIWVEPWLLGGVMLSIVLVGVIYALLLSDTPLGSVPTSALANALVHRVTPVLVPLYWILYGPKGVLQWHDALYWVAYPIAYLGYVLVRCSSTGVYPYPFIHVRDIGWTETLRNAAAIALAFLVTSCLLIGMDHLGRHAIGR